MKEKPIIFSSPMVKVILEDKKDMTRRVVKGLPCTDTNGSVNIDGFWFIPERDKDHAFDGVAPYCVGDILWVRETWRCMGFDDADPSETKKILVQYKDKTSRWVDFNDVERWKKYAVCLAGWKPSIFMPREASRISLEVKHVRLERVQSISERDAVREGMPESMTGASDYSRRCFHSLWDTLNAKRDYGWDKNPWVWAIEFGRVKQ
jgi:hypothetical protein